MADPVDPIAVAWRALHGRPLPMALKRYMPSPREYQGATEAQYRYGQQEGLWRKQTAFRRRKA